MTTLIDAIDGYCEYKKQGLSESRMKQISNALVRFCAVCDPRGKKAVDSIRPADVIKFRDREKASRPPAIINHDLQALSGFFRWCRRESFCEANPTDINPLPVAAKAQRNSVPVRTPQDAWRVIDAMPTDFKRAAIGLLACTGLRIGEAAALRWANWEVDKELLYVDKGQHETTKRHGRVIPVHATLRRFLMQLRLIQEGDWIIGAQGGRLQVVAQANRWLEPHNLTPHDFRRFFRTSLESLAAPEYLIDDLLGHAATKVRRAYTSEPDENWSLLPVARELLDRFSKMMENSCCQMDKIG